MNNVVETTQCDTVVVGLGKTGLACARFLRSQGVSVAVTDSRTQPPGLAAARRELPDVGLALGGFDAALLAGAREIVLSPGVSLEEPALRAARLAGATVISEIELFARHANAPIIAITGSNGKSTVTTWLGYMAQCAGVDVALGGNLGTPALELLRESAPAFYVLELSSFQLETTHALSPAAATVLNISADHMDRYAGLDDYVAAKRRVFQGDGIMVLNLDDPRVAGMRGVERPYVPFSLRSAPIDGFGIAEHAGAARIHAFGRPLLAVSELSLSGRHNAANALAALALGHAMGLPESGMLEALRTFRGLPHRTEWVGRAGSVDWYNDSKGTNVGATVAAIEGMDKPVVLIAGGDGKDADFEPLRPALAQRGRAVVLIGRDAPRIESAVADAVPVRRAADLREAVQLAATLAKPGDVVLFSPACASFDMFDDYEQRGECFRQLVRRSVL